MHIGILFFTDTIQTSFGKPHLMWGRVAANHSFITALTESGACERLTLIVPTQRDAKIVSETLLAGTDASINLISFFQLRAYLAEHPLNVLHCLDPVMSIAGHIRQTLSPSPFAITGVTHSLANDHFLSWALQNNANGVDSDDCLICTTPTAQAVISRAFDRLASTQTGFVAPQTAVIPLGVPMSAQSQAGQNSDRVVDRHPKPIQVLSLARFNPQAKMDFLPILNLAAMLKARFPGQFLLVLAGASDNGVYVKGLQDQAAEQSVADVIRFVSDPDDEQKAALYRDADIFLSLSDNIQETFGLTIIEALAAGCPVVASEWDGYRSLVRHGENGFLVPTRTLPSDPEWEAALAIQLDPLVHLFCAQTTAVDLEATVNFLVQLSEDQELRLRMSAAATASTDEYQWQNIIPRYLALWKKLSDKQTLNPPRDLAPRSSALQFLSDFAGYPTTQLRNDDSFALTESGADLLAGKTNLRLYMHMEEALSLFVMNRILDFCADPRMFQDIARHVATAAACDRFAVARNLLWLYKYGFVRLVS